MKDTSRELAKKTLKPYREAIDDLDRQIMALLGVRFGVVREVAKIKIKYGIPAFLGDRVDEVRNNAVRMSKKYGIDQDFIYSLYTLLIYQSCATEDVIKHKTMQKSAKNQAVKKKAAPKKAVRKKAK